MISKVTALLRQSSIEQCRQSLEERILGWILFTSSDHRLRAFGQRPDLRVGGEAEECLRMLVLGYLRSTERQTLTQED